MNLQFVILLSYFRLRKITFLFRNLAITWPLSWKFQRFNAIDGSIELLKNGWISKKFQLKWKLKYRYTRPKQWTPLTKSSRLPPSPNPPYKILQRFLNKNPLNQIDTNIQTFASKVLQECSSWVSRNGAVQMFFSDTNQKHVSWKICKVRKIFGSVSGAYYFQCQVSWSS